MLNLKRFIVYLKDAGIITIYAEELELYELNDNYNAFNFLINDNVIGIIDVENVEEIKTDETKSIFITEKYA